MGIAGIGEGSFRRDCSHRHSLHTDEHLKGLETTETLSMQRWMWVHVLAG